MKYAESWESSERERAKSNAYVDGETIKIEKSIDELELNNEWMDVDKL